MNEENIKELFERMGRIEALLERLVESKEKQTEENQYLMKDELITIPINEMEFSVRTTNCLALKNIRTLEDLVKTSWADIIRTRNFPKKSLEEIEDRLYQYDLRLGMTQEEINEWIEGKANRTAKEEG